MSARVQGEDFDLSVEINALRQGRTDVGAICSFLGLVRDGPLSLEHYPAMTQKSLEEIEAEAMARFGLQACRIIHRVGALQAGDQIVLVAVASRHRQAAFDGASYIMDHLKSRAPFWKREGDSWVEARESDAQALRVWD